MTFKTLIMKKIITKLLILTVMFLINQQANAQQIVLDKFIQAGGEKTDLVKDIHFDKSGNLYIVGEFYDKAYFSGKRAKGGQNKNVFITRYSEKAKAKKVIVISGEGDNYISSITSDTENNIYVCGDFKGTADFGGTILKSSDYKDNFIAKYSPKGKLQWAKHIKADTKNEKTFIVSNSKGKLYYAGSYFNTINFDSFKLQSESGAGIFVAEMNTKGEFTGAINIGGFNTDVLNDIICSEDGSVYLTGAFKNKLNFGNQQLVSKGETDIFLAKLNDMKPDFVKQFGSYYTDYGKKLFIYKDKILLTGSFSDKINFDKINLQSKGVLDTYIAIFDNKGNVLTANSLGGKANDYAHSIAVSNKGNIYLTGNFRGSIEGKKSTIESDDFKSDIFMVKYNMKGEQVWIENYGGADYDYPVDIITDKNNYIYQTGNFGENFKMDDLKADKTRGNDIYIARFYDCENSEPLNIGDDFTACSDNYFFEIDDVYEKYEWSNGSKNNDTYFTETGSYTLSVTDKFGCEFTDSISITLLPVPKLIMPQTLAFDNQDSLVIDAGGGFATYLWSTGETTQKITVETPDIYTIKVTNRFFCADSAEIEVIGNTFVNNKNNKNENASQKNSEITIRESAELSVYPNPSKGVFTLSLKNINPKNKTTLKVYTIDGQLITEQQLLPANKNLSKKIKLQKIASGSYLLKVVNGGEILVDKIKITK